MFTKDCSDDAGNVDTLDEGAPGGELGGALLTGKLEIKAAGGG